MSPPDAPRQRLPVAARLYWRVVVGLRAGAALLVLLALTDAADEAGIPRALAVGAPAVLALAAVVFLPALWWRRWRYEVRADEIDLQHGVWIVTRTLVPIRRVQHVDTASGPLQGLFGLATVSFNTAAGATAIPALTRSEAEAVRRRVGELAKTRDDV